MSAASPEDTLYPVPARLLDSAQCPEPYVKSFEQYKELHRQSIENSDEFFGKVKLTPTIVLQVYLRHCMDADQKLDEIPPQNFSQATLNFHLLPKFGPEKKMRERERKSGLK